VNSTREPLIVPLLTFSTLVAFAANSVLCRVALGGGTIDAASFSTVRLCSGALTLWIMTVALQRKSARVASGNWVSAAMLFLYAAAFSFAYVWLSIGAGALILFAAVQATMILGGLRLGERPRAHQWAGLAAAMGGLVYLVLPGLAAPPAEGAALMASSGVAWGIYSLRGRGAGDPAAVTAGNFARAVPFALVLSAIELPGIQLSRTGLLLAALSGSVTSGLGYVMWYAALRRLTATRAAIVQLATPVLAAFGGVVFLSEPITLRMALAAAVILVGVALATAPGRSRGSRKTEAPQTPTGGGDLDRSP
jgi:drug/metabolite transporter (DMT)-like permease